MYSKRENRNLYCRRLEVWCRRQCGCGRSQPTNHTSIATPKLHHSRATQTNLSLGSTAIQQSNSRKRISIYSPSRYSILVGLNLSSLNLYLLRGYPIRRGGKKGKKKKKSHPPPKQTNIISSSVISQNATTNRDNKTISLPTTPRPQRNRLNLGREGLSLFNPALHPQRP